MHVVNEFGRAWDRVSLKNNDYVQRLSDQEGSESEHKEGESVLRGFGEGDKI